MWDGVVEGFIRIALGGVFALIVLGVVEIVW